MLGSEAGRVISSGKAISLQPALVCPTTISLDTKTHKHNKTQHKHNKTQNTHTHTNTVLSLSRRPFRCSPLAFAQQQPLCKATSLHPCRVCSKTTSLEWHLPAPLSCLLKHSLSGTPSRCSPLAFAQQQPLWKAISLQPARV